MTLRTMLKTSLLSTSITPPPDPKKPPGTADHKKRKKVVTKDTDTSPQNNERPFSRKDRWRKKQPELQKLTTNLNNVEPLVDMTIKVEFLLDDGDYRWFYGYITGVTDNEIHIDFDDGETKTLHFPASRDDNDNDTREIVLLHTLEEMDNHAAQERPQDGMRIISSDHVKGTVIMEVGTDEYKSCILFDGSDTPQYMATRHLFCIGSRQREQLNVWENDVPDDFHYAEDNNKCEDSEVFEPKGVEVEEEEEEQLEVDTDDDNDDDDNYGEKIKHKRTIGGLKFNIGIGGNKKKKRGGKGGGGTRSKKDSVTKNGARGGGKGGKKDSGTKDVAKKRGGKGGGGTHSKKNNGSEDGAEEPPSTNNNKTSPTTTNTATPKSIDTTQSTVSAPTTQLCLDRLNLPKSLQAIVEAKLMLDDKISKCAHSITRERIQQVDSDVQIGVYDALYLLVEAEIKADDNNPMVRLLKAFEDRIRTEANGLATLRKSQYFQEILDIAGVTDEKPPHGYPSALLFGGYPLGIVNLGSTCYMNAVLQAYFSIPEFVSVLKEAYYTHLARGGDLKELPLLRETLVLAVALGVLGEDENIRATNALTVAFSNVEGIQVAKMAGNLYSFKNEIDKLIDNFNDSNEQHDAQEFMVKYIEQLHEELRLISLHGDTNTNNGDDREDDTNSGGEEDEDAPQEACNTNNREGDHDTSLQTSKHLYLQCVETITCSCGASTTKNDVWESQLALNVCGSVQEGLDALAEPEENVEKNCDACGVNNSLHIKQLQIGKLPTNVVIVLKRYCSVDNGLSSRKDSAKTKINSNISLASLVDESIEERDFELVAVVDHSGDSPTGGHYTTIAKRTQDGMTKWLKFDDAVAEIVDIDNELHNSSNCYILIYSAKKVVSSVGDKADTDGIERKMDDLGFSMVNSNQSAEASNENENEMREIDQQMIATVIADSVSVEDPVGDAGIEELGKSMQEEEGADTTNNGRSDSIEKAQFEMVSSHSLLEKDISSTGLINNTNQETISSLSQEKALLAQPPVKRGDGTEEVGESMQV